MSAPLISYASSTAPRYTSYPTAPHFHDGVDAACVGAWLRALESEAKLSLYLHVPFCQQMCFYCGCHTKVVNRLDPVIAYGAHLKQEIERVGSFSDVRRKVLRIHWGGGTPSMLPAAQFAAVIEALHEQFDLSMLEEHAIELDPRSVTHALAQHLAAGGINRASLGVQDMNPHVQEAIGRVQSLEVVEQAVAHLRAAGISAINLDIMYGLPHQRLEDVRETVRIAASLAPSRIAAFGYAHVPWFKTHQRMIRDEDLPDASARLAQSEAIGEELAALGYEVIGFDHFAHPDDSIAIASREGRLKRNFQGYTDDPTDALIGFGSSAISSYPQGYAQNYPDMGSYKRAVEAGELPIQRGIAISMDDRVRRDIIERLMCDFTVDLAQITAHYQADYAPFAAILDTLKPLERDGLLTIHGSCIDMTQQGRPFVRVAAAAFDAYMGQGKARHSKAV